MDTRQKRWHPGLQYTDRFAEVEDAGGEEVEQLVSVGYSAGNGRTLI